MNKRLPPSELEPAAGAVYVRPQPEHRYTGSERDELLRRYYAEYAEIAARSPELLNRKVPRAAFRPLIDRIGAILVGEAELLASRPGLVRDFLDEHPLPCSLEGKLPREFRAFCLAVNALKQWVNAEQAATDRYLLGGNAREACRGAAETCVVSGVALAPETLDLHHPVRDGRPPIPLDKDAHARIEGQTRRQRVARQKRGNGEEAPSASSTLSAAGITGYRASTLSFRAATIEPLGLDDAFRIITPKGIFRLTKREFYETFANVVVTPSYRERGVYGYTQVPAKANRFLEQEAKPNEADPALDG